MLQLRYRSASIVIQRTRRGRLCRLASTSASTVAPITETLVSTSPLSALPSLIVCTSLNDSREIILTKVEWQWDQLRIMKVGGNESATKFFQSHGGSAALASKDMKAKYESTAAVKYKEELKRRAAEDAKM